MKFTLPLVLEANQFAQAILSHTDSSIAQLLRNRSIVELESQVTEAVQIAVKRPTVLINTDRMNLRFTLNEQMEFSGYVRGLLSQNKYQLQVQIFLRPLDAAYWVFSSHLDFEANPELPPETRIEQLCKCPTQTLRYLIERWAKKLLLEGSEQTEIDLESYPKFWYLQGLLQAKL